MYPFHEFLTGSNAHSGCTDLGSLAFHLGEESGDLAGASTSEGVTHGDRTTIRVHLVAVQSEMLNAIARRKRRQKKI